MKEIDDLLNAHASDKHSQNGYGPIYHALFKHLRDKPIALLEIGIGTVIQGAYCSMYGHDLPGYRPGASLRAWRDYFTYGSIYGIDVQPDTMIAAEPRITTALCDTTNADAVRSYVSRSMGFDIIIDDGAHIPWMQLATLRNFFPALRPDGLYVIEDVNRVDLNQERILIDRKEEFESILGADALYFQVSMPKADVIVISKRATVTAAIDRLYLAAKQTPSDINEHVPRMREIGASCDHITEFGVRTGVSTAAWAAARPKKLLCYDLARLAEIDRIEEAAKDVGIEFVFHQGDVLTATIEPTDLLFIDTLHVYDQLRAELARHAAQVRSWIVLHDTETFGHSGEVPGSRGLWPAVEEFLQEHPEWVVHQRYRHNNGLTVLTRR